MQPSDEALLRANSQIFMSIWTLALESFDQHSLANPSVCQFVSSRACGFPPFCRQPVREAFRYGRHSLTRAMVTTPSHRVPGDIESVCSLKLHEPSKSFVGAGEEWREHKNPHFILPFSNESIIIGFLCFSCGCVSGRPSGGFVCFACSRGSHRFGAASEGNHFRYKKKEWAWIDRIIGQV